MSKGYKIRAIIKRPDERYGHVTNISDTLKNLQKTVDGRTEVIQIAASTVIIKNRDDKIFDLPKNFKRGKWPVIETIRGTVAVVGIDGDGFCDCPISFKVWKQLLKEWGNE